MRIELLVHFKDGKTVHGHKPMFTGFIFTDASPDLDLAFNARFWEAGAVMKARVLQEKGWSIMGRGELEKLLTANEDPERARLRTEKEEAASTHATVDNEALRAQIAKEMQESITAQLMPQLLAQLREQLAAEKEADVAAAVQKALEEAEAARAAEGGQLQ